MNHFDYAACKQKGSPRLRLGEAGFAHLVLIMTTLLLLAGIGIAVYLTQFTQVFKPKADETPLTKITEENYETTLNPWGDPWAWKKNPKQYIPTAASGPGPTEYLKLQDSEGTILERYAKYLAKANSPFLFLDSYEPFVEGQNPKSIALINRVKQLNPNILNPDIKFLGYIVYHEAPPDYNTILQNADNGDADFEAFFVHKKDKPPTKENRFLSR